MDKQMIEEARKLCPHYADGKCYYDVTEISYCDCECEFCWAVDWLKNAGYRKIPELPKNTVLTSADIAELLTIVSRDTRKETAEKFAEKAKERFTKAKNAYKGASQTVIYHDKMMFHKGEERAMEKAIQFVDEIAKEFTGGKNDEETKTT